MYILRRVIRMRKIYKGILVILLCVMLAGCGNKESEANVIETSEVEVVDMRPEQ